MTQTVFLVEHVHEMDDGSEDIKTIGIYQTREAAEAAVVRSRKLSGFSVAPDGFHVNEYTLDVDHWTSGYITEG